MPSEIAEVAGDKKKVVVESGEQILRMSQGFIPPAEVEIGDMGDLQAGMVLRPIANRYGEFVNNDWQRGHTKRSSNRRGGFVLLSAYRRLRPADWCRDIVGGLTQPAIVYTVSQPQDGA
jgi:hypothetical protein